MPLGGHPIFLLYKGSGQARSEKSKNGPISMKISGYT